MARSLIETGPMSKHLRGKVINTAEKKIMVSRLAGSDQSADLTVPANIEGYGRVRHFNQIVGGGWPDNPLPIRPAARWLRRPEPLQMEAQIFQLAACAWRCWYCFVPFNLLSADPGRSGWFSADKLVESYLAQAQRPPILDLTGGSPDLAPEWIGWTMDAVEKRNAGSSLYLWSDDNLSNDFLLKAENAHLLKRLENYGRGYGKVCCLKGFDPSSFSFTTGAEASGFDEQLRILAGYAHTNLDIYLYITLTSPERDENASLIRTLVRRLADIRPDLPHRTVPLRIMEYGPMIGRLDEQRRHAVESQMTLVKFWQNAVYEEAGHGDI
jgi:uncharacterized Fe-S cluster-containing radical SAM superfamily protein